MTMKINRKIGFSWIMKFKKFFRVPDFLRKVHDGTPRIRYYSLLLKMINMLSWKSSTKVINFDHLISQIETIRCQSDFNDRAGLKKCFVCRHSTLGLRVGSVGRGFFLWNVSLVPRALPLFDISLVTGKRTFTHNYLYNR